jgi:hypothetical protein
LQKLSLISITQGIEKINNQTKLSKVTSLINDREVKDMNGKGKQISIFINRNEEMQLGRVTVGTNISSSIEMN